jgi:hypothetical protein
MNSKQASRKRLWFWLPMLAVAAWLALFGDKTPVEQMPLPTTKALTTSPTKTKTVAEPVSDALVELIPREELIDLSETAVPTSRDLFADRSWAPPPPTVVTVEPPAPTAPPLPFTYLGKQLEEKRWRVFLGMAEQTFVVSEGSTINDLYRIDTISPPNLSLTYLPLGQSQTLSIGETR